MENSPSNKPIFSASFTKKLNIANKYKTLNDLPLETQLQIRKQVPLIKQASKEQISGLYFQTLIYLKLAESQVKDLVMAGEKDD